MSAEEIASQAEKTEAPVTEESVPSGFTKGLDTIEYNEYPDFDKNLISDAFIKKMVGQFNNENPEASFEAGGDDRWHIFGKSKPDPKDKIKFMMAKRQKEGFPTIEIMGYAEFEGVTAAACWETMENHEIRKEWDGNMAEFHTIELCGKPAVGQSGSWHEVCYSKTKYPFPLSARDCVYSKYISLDFEKGIFFCVWRPCTHPKCPKTKKVTRSWSYGAQLMYQMPGNKMRVWQAGCGDPKGHIPAWLINVALPKIAVAGVRDLCSKTAAIQEKFGPSPQTARKGGGTTAVAEEPVNGNSEPASGGAEKTEAPELPEASAESQ